jgi:hypothetical protein
MDSIVKFRTSKIIAKPGINTSQLKMLYQDDYIMISGYSIASSGEARVRVGLKQASADGI